MITSGMNVAEVRQLAQTMQQGAERLRGVVSTVDGRVSYSSWVGPQAERFRQEFWPARRAQLLQAAEALQGLARSANDNADEQVRVSAGGSAGDTSGLSGAASAVLAVTGSLAFKAGKKALDALKIATGYATMSQWHAAAWSRMFDEKFSTKSGLVRSIADRASPWIKAAEKHPFIALKNSPVAAALRHDGAVRTVFQNAHKFVAPLSRVLGFSGVVTEGAQAVQLWRQGDKVGAVLGGVDAAAAAAKAHPLPLVKGIGYGVDLGTDLINIARGKQKGLNPWSLL